jgi:GntR family transcriptional regulator/MocR family aminotransferase
VKRAPDALGPVVSFDRRQGTPIHRQLYDGYRAAILDGRLRPGQRLPSTRALAEDLGVSRIPVITAFTQLLAEGYVQSRSGAGTFVSNELPDQPARMRDFRSSDRGAPPGPRRVPESRLKALEEPWLDLYGPFRLSQPALDEFPADLWARLVARHARRLSPRQMAYGDPMGLPALREALATHLRTFRSVACTPEQIMIVSGAQQALTLVALAVLSRGDGVWLEEPGYHGARDALALADAKIVPVPVDDDGLNVSKGVARAQDARAAYVTPSHQYPLGVVMSAPRRLQVLAWARGSSAWIIEDDYDAEFRFAGPPLASLQGLDRDARVIYVGTFSKILFPALRVGFLVLPHDLVPRLRRFRDAMDIFPAPLMQAVLADLIREGHFARHLRRMRALYAERRRALVEALVRELGPMGRVVGDPAGMHLVVLLQDDYDDVGVAHRAMKRGISAAPLSTCYTGRKARPGLVLSFAATRPKHIPEAVRQLKAALRA